MWYIISPKKIEYFLSLNIPKKDKYGNNDLDLFAEMDIGQEFFNLEPLKIGYKTSKKELINSISVDISWISMCYNIPLYIYVISDRYYNKNINLGFSSCTHLSRNQYIQEAQMGMKGYSLDKAKSFIIPKEQRYQINLYEDVEKRISSWINELKLNKNYYYVLNYF